jgi:hypothetical protein
MIKVMVMISSNRSSSAVVARLLRANFSLERSLWVRELGDESA